MSEPDPFSDALRQFLTGELSLETAARAMSRSRETHFVSAGPADDSPPEVRARMAQLAELFARVQEINEAERLLDRRAVAVWNDDWAPPPDPVDFCFSIEVVLSGRDRQQSYTESLRLYVCSPAWIARRVREGGPLWMTVPLVLPRWKGTLVQRALDEMVHGASDDKWFQFVARMSRVMEVER